MSDQINDLKDLWQGGQKAGQDQAKEPGEIIRLAESQKEKTTNQFWTNTYIMVVTFLVLVFYFVQIASFQETLSHIGIALMLGGLGIRILLEVYSISKAKAISVVKSAGEMNSNALAFHKFRKRLQSPFTIIIILLYSIGVFMLMPELSKYFSKNFIILISIGYLVGTVIYSLSIKKGLEKENQYLKEIIQLEQEFQSE